MPSLTLFRTYLVQVYNIMRNVTTFLKVIFVHFSKDNETVSFIKLLDFGLSQGRVSAVSIKCVVICSKFITFAVTKTTLIWYLAENQRNIECARNKKNVV